MEALAKIATDSELRAMKVERQADDIKKAEYMFNNVPIGSKYTALISAIEEDCIKVILPNMIYGKVYYNPRGWTISKDGFSLMNNNDNGTRLLVGDSIEVKLEKINVEVGEVIFSSHCCMVGSMYEEKSKKKVKKR